MKTQSGIRIFIFSAWLFFWAVTSVILLLAPRLRPEIGYDQILPSIGSVASIWLPILSCFAGYWFTHEERHQAALKSLSLEQIVGAVGLSCAYLIFVMGLILWATYGIDYSAPEYKTLGDLPKDLSFKEQLNSAVKMSLWISPLATAPVLALTSRAKNAPTRNPIRAPKAKR